MSKENHNNTQNNDKNQKVSADLSKMDLSNKKNDTRGIDTLWIEAARLEQVREEVKLAKRNKKVRRIKFIRLAAAAVIFWAVIIPVGLFLNDSLTNEKLNDFALDNGKNNLEIELFPKFRGIEEKASQGQFIPLNYLTPTFANALSENQDIMFRWTPELPSDTFLTITNSATHKLIFREKVSAGDTLLKIESGILKSGKYYWGIEGFSVRDSFQISIK